MKSGCFVSAMTLVMVLSLSTGAGPANAGQAARDDAATSTPSPISQAARPLGSELPLCNELADRAFLEGLRTKGMMDNVRAGFKLLALKSETFNDCYGFYSFFDQRSYEGEWKNGQPHGKGTMWFTDGRTFLGEFENGIFTGLGAEYGEDGTVTRSGRWANDDLVEPMPTSEVRDASGGWFNVEARKTPPPVPANQAAASKKAREEKEKREAEAAALRAAEKAREKEAREAERAAKNAARNKPRQSAEPVTQATSVLAQAVTAPTTVATEPARPALAAVTPPADLIQKVKILEMPPTEDYYPASARATDQQGAAKVRACIEPNARVSSVEVIESSGFKDLDDAAVKLGRDGRYQAARTRTGPVAACVTFRIKFGLVNEAGGYFADARQNLQDEASNTYSGGLKEGQRNGPGTLTFPDGSTYIGNFKNNKFDGLGTYTWTNGQRYVGNFSNGVAEGRGTLTFADGGRYDGNFRDGKFNGQGNRLFANGGGSYSGEFRDNQISGQGTFIYADGRRHVGSFVDGKPAGPGTLFAVNGAVLQRGSWVNDMFVPDEAERLAAERAAAERAAAERLAAERATAERLAAERREAERLLAERLAAERAAAERLAAERAAAERLAAERAAAERLAAERAAAERLAAERREAERVAAARREAERLAAAAPPPAPAPAVSANGARRIALVIGNRNYISVPPLRNARADAEAMANALEQIGFEVLLRKDLDDRGLRQAMREFKARLDGGSEAVFYYAGHGVQLGAANYLLPINITSDSEEQIKDEALMLQRVLDDLNEQKVRFSVAIVDACRDNPFPKSGGTRNIGGTRGLAPTQAATGQMVLFSAGSGQSALDNLGPNDRDPNGVFTRVLLKEMARPGVPVDQVLKRTRQEVVSLAKSVGHEQVPALYDQTIGEFFFRPAVAAPQQQVAAAPAIAPAAAMMAAIPTDDRALWESVKDSKNPEEIQAYLTQFPKGLFSGVANARLRAMRTPAPAPVAPTAPMTPASMGSVAAPAASIVASGSLGVGKGQLADDLQRFGAGTVFRDCADCPEMVVVPPGRFEMGLGDTRKVRRPTEGPAREVTIPGTFAVGRSEVTWGQYSRFARETNRPTSNGCATFSANKFKTNAQANWANPGFQQTENDPVVCVSWLDAKAFTDWLGNKTGRNYRLLTEAEWEYVARAGSKGDLFWGENPADACRYANVADATGRNALGLEAPFDCRDRFTNTAPATTYLPNAFGVHDLFGNAEEWVLDCWNENYRNAPGLGMANMSGDCDRRVVRGGSWFDGTETIRATARNEDGVNVRFSTRGFRVARTN